ncbi:helix-turn-helix transcriptional regulator [Mycobacterium sp. KBS0706]|uniref:helix-turn-helix transcriptional regulator n=1 Tax=Mycobacterium sp. KBS0706 TaxID=2578109 RepID=UPI00110FF064|nr:helix-turn-helix transcriptional regulator [Mycobacterium sp. KBS0706]TSD85000.1 helix-turn-helix transcriptional regulator [Mycobacterium sp. KBS0706]
MQGRSIGRSAARPAVDVPSVFARADDHSVLGLIDQIYDAGIGNEDWFAVLRQLGAALGGESVVLRRISPAASCPATMATETDPDYVERYQAHYRQLLPLLPMLPMLEPGATFAHSALIPDAEYRRTEFYNDFMRPQGKDHGLYWVDFDRRDLSAMLSVWRPGRRADWDDDQVRMLRAIGPHLRRALRIERGLAAVGTSAPAAALPPPPARRWPLTPRECDCLTWISRGASSKEAARRLSLSVYTVNEYVASAMRKLGAGSRAEAVAMALLSGAIGG